MEFREPQSPWFFSQPPTTLVDIRASTVAVAPRKTLPTPDNRYPKWAAPMQDARLVTDYRSQCELNIPTGMQYATRLFMQRNADSIISQSRKRLAQSTGAGNSYDSSTLMPAESYVKCDTVSCSFTAGDAYGVGVERKESTPHLFGTFSQGYGSVLPASKPSITHVYEGGRNSIRRF
jgi:hypothetical protein